MRANLDAFHAKLAPIKCTPATLEAEGGDEPVLLRASYYHSLPNSQRPAFSRCQQQAPEYTCVSDMKQWHHHHGVLCDPADSRAPIMRCVCVCAGRSPRRQALRIRRGGCSTGMLLRTPRT